MDITMKKQKKVSQQISKKGFLFVLPALVFFIVFTLVPVFMALGLSLFSYDGLDQLKFVGFDNFTTIFKLDSVFLSSFKNVFMFAIIVVPLSMILPLLYALLINTEVRGSKFFRAVYYLPGLVSAIAAAAVFRLVFNPSVGLMNSILSIFNIKGPDWLGSPNTAMLSIAMLTLWMGIGGNMIIYLAALKGIPSELYEAAKMDGASPLKSFFKITIPMLAPTTFFIMTMSIIGAFQLYDQVVMLTGGGPANSTMTPVYVIFNRAFGENANFGYASAQAVLLFIVIMIVTFICQRFTKEEV